jgi:predicted nucleotidyltransferase
MPNLKPHELESKLVEIVERLRQAFQPSAIYLFGSYAYGTPGPASDVDILVIVPASDLHPYDRDALAYKALRGLGIAKDVQVYTRQEFEDRAACRSNFEHTVMRKGRLLYAA